MWSWTRLNIARPTRADRTDPIWGGDDLEARPPYGIKWSEHHLFAHSPHNGIEFYRNQFEKLDPNRVVWQPYAGLIELFHPRVQRDSRFFLARVPLIHFWEVEYHYPDRVMRQFGLYQSIPPSSPLDWPATVRLHRIQHSAKNWAVEHHIYIQEWANLESVLVREFMPYDPSKEAQYRWWYDRACMNTVFHITEDDLGRPIPPSSKLLQS